MYTKAEGIEQLEKFIACDGLTEVKEGAVTYYQPQRLRACGALIALGCQISGFRSRVQAEETKWRKAVEELVRVALYMNNAQAQTILKAAKMGWELASVDVLGNNGVAFNLKSPGGSKAKIGIDGKFAR
jgi:hypothetical protein